VPWWIRPGRGGPNGEAVTPAPIRLAAGLRASVKDSGVAAGARHAGTARRRVAAELNTNLERIYQRSKGANGLDQPRRHYMVGSGNRHRSRQLTHIALADKSVRYVRIDQTGTALQWWSVADLRVYA
jgi:hypothetical protein